MVVREGRALFLSLLALLGSLFIATPAFAADAAPAPPADEAALRRRLEEILSGHGVPGMGAVIVDRSGVRWSASIGKANIATGADVTADTLFRVASISKMFIGLSALKLRAEGKLDLDASVRALAPDVAFDNPWEATDPLRVVHLLEHTSTCSSTAARPAASRSSRRTRWTAWRPRPRPRAREPGSRWGTACRARPRWGRTASCGTAITAGSTARARSSLYLGYFDVIGYRTWI